MKDRKTEAKIVGLLNARASLIGSPELSRILGVHVETVRKWARLGRLPKVQLSSRRVKFDPHEIAEWLRARAV